MVIHPVKKLALVVPGGVDRSGTRDVIPAVLSLVERLAARHELHVYALHQQRMPGRWSLRGAQIHAVGGAPRLAHWRALKALRAEHGRAPFDLVQSLWAGPCGLAAVLAGRWLGVPSAVHVAGGELVALPEIGYGGLLRWRGRVRERWVLRHAGAATAASAPILAQIAAQGVAAERLPLGVDLGRWPVRPPRPRIDGEPLRLLHWASLNRVKDAPTLLRAAARLRGQGVAFELDIVGMDTLGGETRTLADALELSRHVRFHGFAPQAQCRDWVERADLLVMPSLHEAGPLVVLEAAVAGVPSVGTRVGHLAEWAGQDAARAVAPRDDAGLAREIAALAADDGRRLAMAARAQALAVAEDADFTAAAFDALHRRLVAQSPASRGRR